MTKYSKRLRGVHGLIISALERDAKEGRPARGEMAAELKAAIAEQYDSQSAMSGPAQAEVRRLREWIKDTGRQFDICTHSVLGGVCDGCGCKRAGGKP